MAATVSSGVIELACGEALGNSALSAMFLPESWRYEESTSRKGRGIEIKLSFYRSPVELPHPDETISGMFDERRVAGALGPLSSSDGCCPSVVGHQGSSSPSDAHRLLRSIRTLDLERFLVPAEPARLIPSIPFDHGIAGLFTVL